MLGINLFLAWQYHPMCTFYVVVFGNDHTLVGWLLENFRGAIERGFLVAGVCELDTWNAPVAKNSSHVFAITMESRQVTVSPPLYLINLDANNIMNAQWLRTMFQTVDAAVKDPDLPKCHSWRGDDSGVTGRVGLFAETFKLVGGYDESLPYPSGGQDVELPKRVGAATGKPIPWQSNTGQKIGSAGYSLPNDPEDARRSLGAAKVCNVADKFQHLRWGQMNTKNWEYVVARGSITKANTDREWMDLGVTVSLVALPEETKEEETKEEETKEEETEEEAVTVLKLLTKLTWGAWRPREKHDLPKGQDTAP